MQTVREGLAPTGSSVLIAVALEQNTGCLNADQHSRPSDRAVCLWKSAINIAKIQPQNLSMTTKNFVIMCISVMHIICTCFYGFPLLFHVFKFFMMQFLLCACPQKLFYPYCNGFDPLNLLLGDSLSLNNKFLEPALHTCT